MQEGSSTDASSSVDPAPTGPATADTVDVVDVSTVERALAAATPADRRLHSDPHDFAGLYIRHRSSFTLHARRYLRDGRDADEVVQEAFLRLFLALPELETELQALAYCRRTITNLCIDRYRAQARRPSLVDLDSVSPEELADDDPGDPVVRAEDAAIVREAMSMLSPLHRAALVKREIEEKTLPVIAQELDIPEDSVKHLLFRARRALRRLLSATSLAPGNDDELASGLHRAAKVGSGGLAGFLLVLALSLGTGPDLRAIPVVGTDLPDLIPVTSPATDKAAGKAAEVASEVASGVANAVSAAVTQVTGAVRSATTREQTPDGTVDPGPAAPLDAGGPVPAPVPSRTPSPTPTRTTGPVLPGLPVPVLSPSVAGKPSLTSKTGGDVAPGTSPTPTPHPHPHSPGTPAHTHPSTGDPSGAGGRPSPSGKPTPSAEGSTKPDNKLDNKTDVKPDGKPDTKPDAKPEVKPTAPPAPPAAPADPVAPVEPVPVPVPVPEAPALPAPVAPPPVVPAVPGPVESLSDKDGKAERKTERKAGRKQAMDAGGLPSLSRPATVVATSLASSLTPTSIELPVTAP